MGVFSTREVSYATESSFAESAGSESGLSFSKRLPALDVRPDFGQERGDDGSLQVRANHSRPGYLGPRSGSFELDVYWCGHNGACTGALTETWLQDLLADGFGGGDVTQVGGTVTAGASATSIPFSGATLVRGGLVRIGAKGDARADGQFVVLGTPVTSPATLLTAAPGVPNNADVIYAAQIAYPSETLGSTKRFLIASPTADAQYIAVGCQLESATLRLAIGELPRWTLKYQVARWVRQTKTVPVVSTLEDSKCAIWASGSVFYQTVATATRATEAVNEIELGIDMGLAAQDGLATGATDMTVVGYQRLPVKATLTLSKAFATDWDTLFSSDGSDSTYKHLLITGSTTDGKATAIYAPRAYIAGQRPGAVDYRGIVNTKVSFRCAEGPDETNELTRSCIRFASA
ncbi:MAG: hypothetical protein AAB706_02860 [Patescibacteria group bacterium]